MKTQLYKSDKDSKYRIFARALIRNEKAPTHWIRKLTAARSLPGPSPRTFSRGRETTIPSGLFHDVERQLSGKSRPFERKLLYCTGSDGFILPVFFRRSHSSSSNNYRSKKAIIGTCQEEVAIVRYRKLVPLITLDLPRHTSLPSLPHTGTGRRRQWTVHGRLVLRLEVVRKMTCQKFVGGSRADRRVYNARRIYLARELTNFTCVTGKMMVPCFTLRFARKNQPAWPSKTMQPSTHQRSAENHRTICETQAMVTT